MGKKQVLVGYASCGIAAGANKVYESLSTILKEEKDVFDLKQTGCIGICFREPLVEVIDDTGSYLYGEVNEEMALEIYDKHIKSNEPILDYLVIADNIETPDRNFFKQQLKNTLRNCGVIDPENIDEYVARDGYAALKEVLNTAQNDVIEEVKKSGLRGLGGGGFSAGRKWDATYKAKGDKKYVICNADEGDPGAFMDRSILECDPHAIIEGMLICAYSVGANEGYIYVRAEYPLAVKRLKIAIKQAEEKGYLGDNIFGGDFGFKLKIKEGAGAFVCGESTALVLSIEGKRGMPLAAPRPRTSVEGLWGKPTVLNNVETFANVPNIIRNGADWFSSIGTKDSKGTKIFAITGKINNTGLIEVPMGMTMREIIFDIAGGISDNKEFKAVQIGGPSGGCLRDELLDLPVDFDSLDEVGAMMGSGGLVVVDETTCMIDFAKFFLNFAYKESCGECAPCRIGTKQMLDILTDITEGRGKPGDIELLESLGKGIVKGSICGLGQSAPNPVLSTIRYFRNEYEDHIINKKCTASVCKSLIHYDILSHKCTGCHACFKVCPVSAISGKPKEVHTISQELCTKCGECIDKCPKKFGAIEVYPGEKNNGGVK